MRAVFKALKPIICVLVVLALIRTALGAGPLQLQELLFRIQQFEFNAETVTAWIDSVQSLSTAVENFGWNDSLPFWENVGNIIVNIWQLVTVSFRFLINVVFGLVLDIAQTLKNAFNVVFYALGLIQ